MVPSTVCRQLIRIPLYSCGALIFCSIAAQAETSPATPSAVTVNANMDRTASTADNIQPTSQSLSGSTATTDEADPYRLHRALRERDFSIGYGRKIPISRFKPRTKVTMYQLLPRWGRFRDDRQEFLWEFPITYVSKPESAYAAGVTLMYRYHFSSNRHFAPFVEAGSGFVFTNLDNKIRELNGGFQFSPQAGIGFRSAISPSSDLVFSARWFHLSNAGTRKPNIGLNNYLITAGYSKLF